MPENTNVLIVDDLPENLAVLGQILKNAGYRVRATLSGELALQAVALEPPDIILLDIMMPEMDGYAVCQRLKANPQTTDIPVLFISALNDASDKVHAFAAGGVDYVGKPFDRSEVLAPVSAHAGLARARHELAAQNRALEHTLETLRTTQAELLQAQKMASLGALVAGAAHALNTPVGTAVTLISTLQEEVIGLRGRLENGLRRSELEGFLSHAEEGGQLALANLERVTRLIEDFKKMAVDRSRWQRRVFSLGEIGDRVLAAIAMRHPNSGGRIGVQFPSGIRLDSHPDGLIQALIYVVDNALVHAYEPQSQDRVEMSAREEGEAVVIEVADSGRGIASENLGRVFDPFYTSHLGRSGTGLGLSIAYGIVTDLLGGHIEIESSPGEGTRVRIEVPRRAPERAAAD